MYDGTLYPQRGVGSSFNVDVKLNEKNFQKICDAEIGSTITLDATAVKGHTGNEGEIFVKRTYDQFFTDGITLDEVEVQTQAKPTATSAVGDGNLYPENITVTIKGTRTEN